VPKKTQQPGLEELVRRHGTPSSPTIKALVSEVRSDDVPIYPPPAKPEPHGALRGVVVIWQFCLPHSDIEEFHSFLRQSETFIGAALAALSKTTEKAVYLGTHMLLSEADVCCTGAATAFCYRVMWQYDSLDAMAQMWKPLLLDENSNFYKMIVQLRAFWLRDPPNGDAGDAFAKLTLAAAKLNP